MARMKPNDMDEFSTPTAGSSRGRPPAGTASFDPNMFSTQSQTIRNDSMAPESHRRNESLVDSDEEIIDTKGAAMSEKRRGKLRTTSSRRFTIEPSTRLTGFQLVQLVSDNDTNTIFTAVDTPQEFADSAKDTPEEWCMGLKNIVDSFKEANMNIAILQQQNEDLGKDIAETKGEITLVTTRHRSAMDALSLEKDASNRLRGLRDRYRDEAISLSKEMELIKAELKKGRQPKKTVELEDSDDEDARYNRRHPSIPITTGSTGLRRPGASHTATSHANTERTEGAGLNKRYPDVPDFHGTHDRNTWDSWRQHLKAKFRQSAVIFPSEYEKIDYIRDHCKSVAYDVIKSRADDDALDPYLTAQEMIDELDSMFGTYDKIAKSNAEIFDPKFGMGFTKKDESFEEFYARFSAAIAPLGFTDIHKISNMKRLISTRLKYRISGHPFATYRELVTHIRALDMDLRAIDSASGTSGSKNKDSKGKGGNGDSTGNQRNSSSKGKDNVTRPRGYKYPQHVVDKIRKEGRCFKCLKPGHRSSDNDAPCKSAEPLTKDQVDVALKAVGVELDEDARTLAELPQESGN